MLFHLCRMFLSAGISPSKLLQKERQLPRLQGKPIILERTTTTCDLTQKILATERSSIIRK